MAAANKLQSVPVAAVLRYLHFGSGYFYFSMAGISIVLSRPAGGFRFTKKENRLSGSLFSVTGGCSRVLLLWNPKAESFREGCWSASIPGARYSVQPRAEGSKSIERLPGGRKALK